MEVFCPPRMVPVAQKNGLTASLSVDLKTGWNLYRKPIQKLVAEIVQKRQIKHLFASPPCTMYSKMVHINKGRMPGDKFEARQVEGNSFLTFAVSLCKSQYVQNRKFVFEHPDGAASWHEPCVVQLRNRPGVNVAKFDECRFGLKSPVGKKPMRKRTCIMTNCMHTFALFDQKFCNCGPGVEHQTIEGHEGGVQLSSYASAYPDGMVTALIVGASQTGPVG